MNKLENATIIVVTFKRTKLLQRALNSFMQSAHTKDIVLVDNNEDADSELKNVCTWFHSIPIIIAKDARENIEENKSSRNGPSLHYLKSNENRGGAGGFSLGIKYARENIFNKYTVLIDDDAEFMPDCMSYLVSQATESDAPFFAPLIFNVNTSKYELNQHKKLINTNTTQETVVHTNEISKTSIPIVANGFVGVMFRTDYLYESEGVYDKFFLWYDDTDLTYRLTRKHGPGLLVTAAIVHHNYLPSAETPYWKRHLEFRSKIIFSRRNCSILSVYRITLSAIKHSIMFEGFNSSRFAACLDFIRACFGLEGYYRPGRYF